MKKPTLNQVLVAMEAMGYVIFDGVDDEGNKRDYDLNIFGIRSQAAMAGAFDDWIGMFWRDLEQEYQFRVWLATTDPGTYYLAEPLNVKGTAVLVEGQYLQSHRIGMHRGEYEALVQSRKLPVYRDANKDLVIDMDPDGIDVGVFGINIHRASPDGTSGSIGRWSAGCQVLANSDDFAQLMDLCKLARNAWGNSFTYTLLREAELPDA